MVNPQVSLSFTLQGNEQPYRQQASFWSKLLASNCRSSTSCSQQSDFKGLFYTDVFTQSLSPLWCWPHGLASGSALQSLSSSVLQHICACTSLFQKELDEGRGSLLSFWSWGSLGIGRKISRIYSEARIDEQPVTSLLSLWFLLIVLQVFSLSPKQKSWLYFLPVFLSSCFRGGVCIIRW